MCQFDLSLRLCPDPSYEYDPSHEYSLLGLTHVMNSIFLDPSSGHWNPQTNSGLLLSSTFQNEATKSVMNIRREDLLDAANALASYRGMAATGRSTKNWLMCQLTG